MKHLLSLLSVAFLFGCASSPTAPPAPAPVTSFDTIAAAVAGPQRSEANRARDVYRHPVETLEFFGLKNDMKVVEISPGQGWYSEILAPFLKEKGSLVFAAGNPESKNDYRKKGAVKFRELVASKPELYGKATVVVFEPPALVNVGEPNSADMVVTFRNAHNWMQEPKGLTNALKGFYTVLKPGGVLGIEEHRAKPGKQDMKAESGYVTEAYLIKAAEQAGFKLAGKSEINANPKDTRNHPEGVWTLPPTLKLGEKDKDKYVAIGESDRMTLKFVKPAK